MMSLDTAKPVAVPSATYPRPEFIRLPKPGHLCPITGLSRSKINELILASEKNDHKPPVRSICLRQKGAKTGIRLINYESLIAYLRSQGEAAV